MRGSPTTLRSQKLRIVQTAALLSASFLLLLAAACGGETSAAAKPGTRSGTSGTSSQLHVRAVGPSSALLFAPRLVTFRFRFLDTTPSTWSWRVAGFYGGVMASGAGTTLAGSDGGSVSWNCTGRGGGVVDPGEYLLEVGPARGGLMTTIARVRFQPPVTARVYRSLPAAGMRVALTFDDGGSYVAWHKILRILERTHTKGTFFPIGLYVGAYAKREAGLTIRDHMAIGSHTWSHKDLVLASDAEVVSQLRQADDIWWRDFQASTVPYLRPPYGAYNAHVLALAGRLGYSRIVLWDVDSLDWAYPGVAAIVRNVLDHVRPGSIILMHTRRQTPAALPLIIAGLKARHYQMVTIPELFAVANSDTNRNTPAPQR